jgi:hypothetical protein
MAGRVYKLYATPTSEAMRQFAGPDGPSDVGFPDAAGGSCIVTDARAGQAVLRPAYVATGVDEPPDAELRASFPASRMSCFFILLYSVGR